ncbi:MAG: hypothetical protein JNM27_09775 [Leptospirales bacterium]|nr:hypothetical protein [Leptospirales bacterium]
MNLRDLPQRILSNLPKKQDLPEIKAKLLNALRNSPASITAFAKSTGPRLKDLLKRLPDFLRSIPATIRSFFDALAQPENGKMRMMTVLWSIVLVFVSVCVLGKVNPFQSIIPILGIHLPVRDSRLPVQLKAYSFESKTLQTVNRRLPTDGTPDRNVMRIAIALSETAGIQETSAAVENMPDYGFSLKRVWVLKEGGCIIDLRSSTLQSETEAFLKNRDVKDRKPQAFYMDAYFQSLTASIFSAKTGCTSVQYLVDGKPSSIKDMTFDLSKSYTN